ncbi:hypothetical protein DPEC_G00281320 [Dallia pectoralis]|uniref:Uncharacterized protein n=1 Tax=Dallia pectoralis TaxID=75939 RepID=A0ACC2FMW6_DALPE|nr:hypothetical protein DPEC_G00281320 [Dallia pectoralis]
MGRQFICLGHAREKFEETTVQDVWRILRKKCNNECFKQVKAEKILGSTLLAICPCLTCGSTDLYSRALCRSQCKELPLCSGSLGKVQHKNLTICNWLKKERQRPSRRI